MFRSITTDLKKPLETIDARNKSRQADYLELLSEKRKILDRINHKSEFDEEFIRKYPALIDLKEYKIREQAIPRADIK